MPWRCLGILHFVNCYGRNLCGRCAGESTGEMRLSCETGAIESHESRRTVYVTLNNHNTTTRGSRTCDVGICFSCMFLKLYKFACTIAQDGVLYGAVW